MNSRTLADSPANTPFLIAKLEGAPLMVARLRELGFIGGEPVSILGRAPFGEPILIEIRGATVALRKLEAQCVHLR